MSHPLDGILAVRHTRRQALRAALAAAALTLPFAGSKVSTARAAGPTDCRKGCRWTADRDFQNRQRGCFTQFVSGNLNASIALFSVPFAFVLGAAGAVKTDFQAAECVDRNVMTNKAALYDCLQPDCPGFDPKREGGPCDGCRDNCCPCQASQNGYICCIFECSDREHNCCPE